MSLQKLIEKKNAKLLKTGDLTQRIKTLAWWIKHTETKASTIKCINDFLTRQKNEMLDSVVEMVKEQSEEWERFRDEQLQNGNVMIAYDMNSRQVAANKIISQLQTLKK